MMADKYLVLNHLYYGENIGQEDMSYLLDYQDRGFSGNPYEAGNERDYSLDSRPQEYSTNGVGDYRINSVSVINADGSDAADWRYAGYTIEKGKYAIPGMPALYGEEKDADTLIVELADKVTGLHAFLYYSVWEERDIITRCVKFVNQGTDAIVLTKAASMNLDLMSGDWELMHFHGRHNLERQMERVPLMRGKMTVESVRGASSHQHNPFAILCSKDTTEEAGPCYGTALVYSGNFSIEAEKDQMGQTRLTVGINSQRFAWTLEAGAEFWTPEAVMTYSSEGFEKMSSNFHHTFREHLCRGKYKHERRPVLINNWEATYFDFDKEKILNIAKGASELGVEMLVLDDGWFGKRDGDVSGLGDWYVNTDKLEGGLKPIADGINAMGMKFGLWFEPECISEDSDLYRAHPDWAIQIPGRQPNRSRYQLILDMGREDVRDYLYERMTAILDSANIEYVKWDMNRHISDIYSAVLPKERQGEASHRYMLGLYDLLERLVSRYPDLLLEGCSGGGIAYAARAVDLRGDGLNLIRQRRVQLVGVLHLGAVVQDGQHGLGQRLAALAALGKDLAQGAGHTGLAADVINNIHLLRSVGGEGIDGNADRQTKALQVLNVAGQVYAARAHGLGVGLAQIGLGHAAVGLERAHRGHQHNGGGVQPGIAALDVKELLRAQIRAEAGLGHNVVGQLEAQPGGNGTVAAVGNVG